jgi:hypothetical protein
LSQYVLRISKVAQSLAGLRSQLIHPHFAAYLCLKRTSVQMKRTTDLFPDFKEFFDTFLKVPDAPDSKPYLRIFLDETASESNRWLNRNLAGSFAPSSLRGTLNKVIEVSGAKTNVSYSFRPKHWELALVHLAKGKPIPIVDLAIVLYRDYALEADKPSLSTLIDVFRYEFGYPTTESGDREFNSLYIDDSDNINSEDWFEVK